jgi:Tol biopolymer transport system component
MIRHAVLLLAAAGLAGGADELETSVALMAKVGFCGSPTFSPDGKRMAFVSNMSGSPQI